MLIGLLIGGPPTIEPEFDMQTKQSLSDKDVTVAVVCFAPDGSQIQLREHRPRTGQVRHLSAGCDNKIDAVPPDRVKVWLEENKDWDKPEEIGAAFKTTYVVYIDLNEFSMYEEGSAQLYRGRAEAIVSVWKMDEDGTAEKIFSMEKISKHPSQNPVSTSEETYTNFKGRYLSRLSDEIGRFFYEYYTSDEIGSGS